MEKQNRYYLTTDSFIIILDSRNATQKLNSSSNSSVLFDFEDTLFRRSFSKAKCSVLTFSSANGLYNINETNNLLAITISNVTTNYQISLGNYNSKTFISTLLSILPVGFNITLNTITNKLTFSYATDFIINGTSTIYDTIGGSLGISYNSTNSILTLPFTVNFNGIQSFNVHLTNVKTRNINSFSKSASTIIQSIPVNPATSQICYNKQNNYSFDLNDEMEYLQIELKDDLNNYINLNNKDWNLTILIEEMAEFNILERNNTFYNIVENASTGFSNYY